MCRILLRKFGRYQLVVTSVCDRKRWINTCLSSSQPSYSLVSRSFAHFKFHQAKSHVLMGVVATVCLVKEAAHGSPHAKSRTLSTWFHLCASHRTTFTSFSVTSSEQFRRIKPNFLWVVECLSKGARQACTSSFRVCARELV